jgi:hypothetical protein
MLFTFHTIKLGGRKSLRLYSGNIEDYREGVKETLFMGRDKTLVEDERAVVTYSINLCTAYDSTSSIRTHIFGQRKESDTNLLFSIEALFCLKCFEPNSDT